MYTGFYLPDGSIPKKIKGNSQQQETDWLNDSTYLGYLWDLFDLALSVFEWKNLPEGINERQIEWWLMRNGHCIFLYDEGIKSDPEQRSPEGYAIMQVMLEGGFDIYNIPKNRTAFSVDPKHATIECDINNSVICFNNNTRTPTFLKLEGYAKRLWRLDRCIDVNIEQQKTSRVVKCDQKQKMTYQNMLMNVDGFMPYVWADKDLQLSNIEVLDLTVPYIADKDNILKHQIYNEALSFIGIENTNSDKKERQVSDEVYANMGDVEAHRFTRLNARKLFCKEVNEMFGLNMDVDFRSGMYIKADGSDINTAVETMKSSSSDGGSLWKRFKTALKGSE